MPIDMREVAPGSAIDEFHFGMWASFIEFALKHERFRAEFEAETGSKFPRPAGNGLEAAIDQACGYDRTADQMVYVAKFAAWDICPAIAAKLAEAA
jgi:hypothetical protein